MINISSSQQGAATRHSVSAHHVSCWSCCWNDNIEFEYLSGVIFFFFFSVSVTHLSTQRPLWDYNHCRQLNIIISNYYNYYNYCSASGGKSLSLSYSCHIKRSENPPFPLTNSIIQETVNEWNLLMRESLVRQLRPRLFRDTNSSFSLLSLKCSLDLLCVWTGLYYNLASPHCAGLHLFLDHRCCDRPEAAGEAGEHRSERRIPSGTSALPTTRLCSPEETRLFTSWRLQPTRRLPRLWQKGRDEVWVQKVWQLIRTES